MNDIVYDISEYETATEAFSISKIKSQISNLIKIICDTIQRFGYWITSKFCKFLNIDVVTINQNYYNDIMRTINMVCNVDLTTISKIDLSVQVLRNNPDKVRLICGDLQKKVDDLRLISENVEKIVPSEYGNKIKVSTSKLKHLKLTFTKMQSDANSQIYRLKAMQNNPDDIELLKYTQAQLTMIGHMATINLTQSSICMRLLDKLMEHCLENKNKGENDDMNPYTLESFINFCDDMQIANEGLNEYKKIYRKTTKDIKTLDAELKGMPETTLEEIDAKMKVIQDIREQIDHAKTLMSRLTPSMFDKFMNLLSIVADSTIITTATLKLKNEVSRFSLGSPEIYHVLKNIAFLLSVTLSSYVITKNATISGKRIGIKDLYEKLSISYNEYSDKLISLRKKRRELEKIQ